MADNTISTHITNVAQNAQSIVTDGTSVSERSLHELIEADKYLTAKRARANPARGLLFTKLVPPGAG